MYFVFKQHYDINHFLNRYRSKSIYGMSFTGGYEPYYIGPKSYPLYVTNREEKRDEKKKEQRKEKENLRKQDSIGGEKTSRNHD